MSDKCQNKYIADWKKDHTVLRRVRLNIDHDADIIARIDAQPSTVDYIRRLIRRDMRKKGAI